jgi:hypothetical protein
LTKILDKIICNQEKFFIFYGGIMKKTIFVVIILSALIGVLYAQSLEDKLSLIDLKNIKGYVEPMANALGAGLNSGFYTSAKTLSPFMPNLKIGTALITVPGSDKKFDATAPKIPGFGRMWEPIQGTSTIFGKENGGLAYKGLEIRDPDDPTQINPLIEYEGPEPTTQIEMDALLLALETAHGGTHFRDSPFSLPGGIDIPAVPVPVASISLGMPFGTDVLLRGLPPIELGDIGKLTYWGLGAKHSLDQYLTDFFPVHLATQVIYQNMSIADVLTINTWAANIQASKKLGPIAVYGGVGLENANLEVSYKLKNYDYDDDGLPMNDTTHDFNDGKTHKYDVDRDQTYSEKKLSMDFDTKNSFKATIGLRLSILPFVGIYGDYNVAEYSSLNAGLEIGF